MITKTAILAFWLCLLVGQGLQPSSKGRGGQTTLLLVLG